MSNDAKIAADVDADREFMEAALALGRTGLGLVAPNPAVGALIIKDGVSVGRGCTQPGGRPHAEVVALKDAGEQARGATMYVTLEPCSHYGKTPPCAEAIIAAGIGRVVSAIEDPDPRVAGRGHQMLRDAGIAVTTGLLAEAARRANLGHILRVSAGRPTITLKLAQTADGYAAGSLHDPRLAITGAAANEFVHRLRSQHDAIMVGSGTANLDDPLMTVRLPGLEARKPLRIVLDSGLSLSARSRLAATAGEFPTLVVAAEGADAAAAERLQAAGVEIASVGRDAAQHLDLDAALALLAARGLTRVFSEGGPRMAAILIGRGLADEVVLLTAPKPLGGEGTVALDPQARAVLADPSRYTCVETRLIGADRLTRYERVL